MPPCRDPARGFFVEPANRIRRRAILLGPDLARVAAVDEPGVDPQPGIDAGEVPGEREIALPEAGRAELVEIALQHDVDGSRALSSSGWLQRVRGT